MTATALNEIRTVPIPQCPLCGTEGHVLYRELPDRLYGAPGKWNLSHCGNSACGLVWLNPKPIREDLSRAYASYYTHTLSRELQSLSSRILIMLLGLAGERRRASTYYLGDLKPGRVLEAGFGAGHALAALRQAGWIVEGQELDAVAYQAAKEKGWTVHLGDLATLNLPSETYDAVVGNHVLEHVYDPITFLQECRRILKPGGVIVFVTPNVNSYGHRTFGMHWRDLDPPRHLHIFSRNSLQTAVTKAGLEPSQIRSSLGFSSTVLRASINLVAPGCTTPTTYTDNQVRRHVAMHLIRARLQSFLSQDTGEEFVLTARRA